jgi:hypothetical protein
LLFLVHLFLWFSLLKIFRFSIPLDDLRAFLAMLRTLMASIADADAKVTGGKVASCSSPILHRDLLIDPEWFINRGLKNLTYTIQKPGQMVVTSPRGAHFGANLGMNFGESVNVGESCWLVHGVRSVACNRLG